MSWLLPHAMRDAITSRGDFGASAAFGIVGLAVLIVLLVEHEVGRAVSPTKARLAPLFAAAITLSVPVILIVVVRVGDLLP
jgi:hypothetical protein